ncbi:MAG: ABC transporter permease subunit [Clostridia bacterium]|nr:ABC transporter permease subunit [Clostridia bacterium]
MSKTPNLSAENSPKTISSILRNKKKLIAKFVAVLSALLVWQLASYVVGSKLLLVSPFDVVVRLVGLVGEEGFFATLGFSFSRIALGFFSGLLCGTLLALLAGRFKLAEILLWPYVITVKSVPVASIVVIALVWMSAKNISALISFLMVLPIVYTNILEGIRSVDRKMLEMADVFGMRFSKRLRLIWLPAIKPFAVSGCRVALGLAWKSGVAAELIGYPKGSIGESLYYSKLYLYTADLFAWTVVIIILSVTFEKLFVFLLKKAFERSEKA